MQNLLSACAGAYVCTRARRLGEEKREVERKKRKEDRFGEFVDRDFGKVLNFSNRQNKFSNLLGSVFGMMYFCLRKRSRRLR